MVLVMIIGPAASDSSQTRQAKHPQEMDLSDLEDDLELINLTERRSNKMDCDTFYRRLVKHLFHRKRFHHDPSSSHYIASVPLRLKQEQWELLVDLKIDGLNLNEIDDLLADVLKQSNDADFPVAQILFDHYRYQLIESLPSLSSPIVLSLIAILVILVMNRLLHFSTFTYSALILFLFLCIIAVSYAMTYWDCLSDLEVEQMIQLSKKQSSNNPCKDYDAEQTSFFTSLKAYFLESSENKCLEHMRKTFKTSNKYCDPLDVLAKWFGKIQMSYFSSILGGFLELISRITSSSGFMTKIIMWTVAGAVFVFVFLSFGREVIVHGFKGMFGILMNTKLTPERPNSSNNSDYLKLSSKLDEVINENREMKRELSIIRECSVERSLPKVSPRKIKDDSRMKDIDEESS